MSEPNERARNELHRLARDMLSGGLSYIEGARLVKAVGFGLDGDADIRVFVAIESETDAFPMGQFRKNWHQSALVALQPEIDAAEEWAKQFGAPHCQSLIDRFAKKKPATKG